MDDVIDCCEKGSEVSSFRRFLMWKRSLLSKLFYYGMRGCLLLFWGGSFLESEDMALVVGVVLCDDFVIVELQFRVHGT